MPELTRICVYAGSRAGNDPAFRAATERLAERLADDGIGVVYGGAQVGLMGVLADRALERGGEVIGVIPRQLTAREIDHRRLTELHVVDSMHERKALMAELSDGFVALPGGIGTLEELIEMFTWRYLGLHAKPLGLVDVDGYYEPLTAFLDGAVDAGFLDPVHRSSLVIARDPDAVVDGLDEPPAGRTFDDPANRSVYGIRDA